MALRTRWAVPMLLVALTAGGAGAADPSKADIQWAQTVLKERGFYQGRENGEMNDALRAALGGFQKKVGLPVTGRLDEATVAKLMEGRPASNTTGNLAAPRDPAKPKPRADAPPPKPEAAPKQRVDAGGGNESATGGFSRSGEGPSPQAAPRADVSREAAPGAPAPTTEPPGPGGLFVPGWVRAVVMGVLGITVLAAIGLWWASGRRGGSRRPADAPDREGGAERLEPSLGPAPRGDTGLRADPPLRAGGRP